MMSDTPQEHTELIAVDAITVVNPRIRNQKVFDEIVANIAELGLKRPITVAAVRRQSFWVQRRPKLRERLAHLVGLIMRRVACDASGALRVSFV